MSKQDKETFSKLEADIESLENVICHSPEDDLILSLNKSKRQHLIDGLIFRSRANWHENGEKCSEYFCKLEKNHTFIKPWLRGNR